MRSLFATVLILICFATYSLSGATQSSVGEKKLNHDPEAAQLITSDIDNFWVAYDRAAKSPNPGVAFQLQYFDKGSAGLLAFKRARIDQCALAETVARYPGYYDSIRASTLRIPSMKEQIRASFRKLKELYEPAVFPDVYFLIGCRNSGGTTADAGLLIGAEMYGRTPDTPEREMDDWLKAVTKPVELIPHIVAHELIHYQQKYSPAAKLTLLAASITEGSADFVGELISGKHINTNLHDYGNPREAELWAVFKAEMDGSKTSNWLYQGEQAKGRPADLGYYVGYKICEAFYKNAADKKQAVKEILEIKDFKKFLADSGYEKKFGGVSVRTEVTNSVQSNWAFDAGSRAMV